jgi:hypothetical protein
MATDVGVGDAETPYLDVAPADAGTAVTLEARKPDGTASSVTMTGGDLAPIPGTTPVQYSQRWTANTPVVYTQPGRWVLHYEVTGTGEGTEDLEVFVAASPTAGGPTWLPGRSRVANYVPHRTLVRSTASVVGSQDSYELTFDSSTIPTGVQVDRLIADGAAWVTARVAPLNVLSEPAASVIATLWAAAAVERGWPQDDSSLQRANDLEKRMDTLMAGLLVSNENANSDAGTADPATHVQPQWSFPAANPAYDSPWYW